jgi:hypothetical protein
MEGPTREDVQQLCHILEAALSGDSGKRQQAEATLRSLSTREGFCTGLIGVLQAQGVHPSTKQLAAVQLKNNVSTRWSASRASASSGFTDREKELIRDRILTVIGLQDAQLAVQVAIVVAKIARHDYLRSPPLWADLFDRLTSAMFRTPPGEVTSRRAWLTLHHTIKELSTKRLPSDRRRLRELASSQLPIVWAAWHATAEQVMAHLVPDIAPCSSADVALAEPFEAWLLQTKVLRRLIMDGLVRCERSTTPALYTCQMSKFSFFVKRILSEIPRRCLDRPVHVCAC